MALVNHDEIEEVRRIFAEIRRRLAVFGRPAHKRLKDREKDAGVFGYAALLANCLGLNAGEGIFWKRRKRVVSLIGKDVAVGEEENARASRRLASKAERVCQCDRIDIERTTLL
jgi:hypothetical protein